MKLTDEQIAELAPEWATHYKKVNLVKVLVFESIDRFQFYYESGKFSRVHVKKCGVCKGSKPLKPKPFDITQHEWSDEAKDCGITFNTPAWVMPDVEISIKDVYGGDNTGVLLREHAIALAKHFGLTVEDLK